ncbi:hypothetical protein MKX42_30235 [Paenibacillus sp. FSL R7-0204]|uniref:hypothetical protein n=1 Tax=Paenibacillus sp. FSL R7-0204 TaxID=2921675 RepID=UPI0030F7301A
MDRIPGGWHSATAAGLCNPWISAAGKLAETGARTEGNEGWLKVGLASGLRQSSRISRQTACLKRDSVRVRSGILSSIG